MATKKKLACADCLEKMKSIPDNSVDMVMTDPPYGTTQNKWDSVVPLEPMWEQLLRVTKNDGAIVMTANQPFTTTLIASKMDIFRYCWAWEKSIPTGHLNVSKRPMKSYEDVVVFYQSQVAFNPIMTRGPIRRPKTHVGHSSNYGKQKPVVSGNDGTQYNPKDIIAFDCVLRSEGVHPTQKPVGLMKYLIKTYTKEGDTVLDFCMGSGTTGVACVVTGRNFIGIERSPEYFEIAKKRIDGAESQIGFGFA